MTSFESYTKVLISMRFFWDFFNSKNAKINNIKETFK